MNYRFSETRQQHWEATLTAMYSLHLNFYKKIQKPK